MIDTILRLLGMKGSSDMSIMSRSEIIQSRVRTDKQIASLRQMTEDFAVEMFIQREVTHMLMEDLQRDEPRFLAIPPLPRRYSKPYVVHDPDTAKYRGKDIGAEIIRRYKKKKGHVVNRLPGVMPTRTMMHT